MTEYLAFKLSQSLSGLLPEYIDNPDDVEIVTRLAVEAVFAEIQRAGLTIEKNQSL